ncbi:hypothetical protein, partial [Streptomyces sp. NBC_01304]|uniref:hypothetical protein n=1 Tax=Streptomyces sp. NBC_01304 TaxID=2903818 RepID=UPI002E12006A
LKKFLTEFHARVHSPDGECVVVYVGPLTRPLVLRVDLPDGKSSGLFVGCVDSPGGESVGVG